MNAKKDTIYIKQMELGPMENFVYLIGDPRTKDAVVVDPAWNVPAILTAAEKDGYKIRHALVTHQHFDHINGVDQLVAATDCLVHINKNELPFVPFKGKHVRPTDSGDELKLGDVSIQFMHTPGHTPGSQCFVVQNNLVSGDTLFINACGRTDLPGGDPEQMYWSLNSRIKKLGDNVILFPGHNYADVPTTTLGEQKKHNPYMMCETLQDFLARVGY